MMHVRQVKQYKQLVVGGHQGGMEELKDFVDKKVPSYCRMASSRETETLCSCLKAKSASGSSIYTRSWFRLCSLS